MRLDMRSVVVGVLAGLAFSLAAAAVVSGSGEATGQEAVSPGDAAPAPEGPYQLDTINVPSRYGAKIKQFVIDQAAGKVWELVTKDDSTSWKLVTAGPPKKK